MTTGWPAASFFATCGRDPIDLRPPFGGRQGTRLKMSLAAFALSLTLSIALIVRFLIEPAAGSAGARLLLPATALLDLLPDAAMLPLSDVAACATCARDADVSSTDVATARATITPEK